VLKNAVHFNLVWIGLVIEPSLICKLGMVGFLLVCIMRSEFLGVGSLGFWGNVLV